MSLTLHHTAAPKRQWTPVVPRMASIVTVARCGAGGDMVQGRKCAVAVPSLDCHLRYLVLVPLGFINFNIDIFVKTRARD